MESTLENHKQFTNQLCRICKNHLKRQKGKTISAKPCSKYQDEILSVFGINIMQDDECVHPKKFCFKCYREILDCRNARRNISEGKLHSLRSEAQKKN